MFEKLQDRLERSFKMLKGQGKITEINISQTLKDVRKALLEADVNYKVAKQFTDSVKQEAMGQNVINALKPQELMLSIVRTKLIELMGGEKESINLMGNPSVILMSGLQGSGKTTFTGKLAYLLKRDHKKKPLLVACDVYRPAAITQLQVVGAKEDINVPVYTEEGNMNPVQIALNGIRYAKDNNLDVVIIDTAGRLAIDEAMMQEITDIKAAVNPQETLFVVDAMTGQDAVNTAKTFNERLDFDGVVLTKLDGDTRGGAALSIRTVVDKPIKFVGRGENPGDIDVFNPESMASRIMGNGDLWGLAERAANIINEEEAKRLEERIRKNKFDFDDFLRQIQQIKKMGNIKDLAAMIPGVGKAIRDIEIDNNAFKPIEAIISSMTPYERQNPTKIDASRRKRIAAGSGTKVEEVNRLLKQFEASRKMMQMATGGNPLQRAKEMQRQLRQQQRRR